MRTCRSRSQGAQQALARQRATQPRRAERTNGTGTQETPTKQNTETEHEAERNPGTEQTKHQSRDGHASEQNARGSGSGATKASNSEQQMSASASKMSSTVNAAKASNRERRRQDQKQCANAPHATDFELCHASNAHGVADAQRRHAAGPARTRSAVVPRTGAPARWLRGRPGERRAEAGIAATVPPSHCSHGQQPKASVPSTAPKS